MARKRWSHSERVGLGSYARERLLNRLNDPNRPQPSENLTRVLDCLFELNEIVARDPMANATRTGEETETVVQVDGKDHILFGAPTRAHELEYELSLRLPRYRTFSQVRLRKGKLKVFSASATERGLKATDSYLVPLLLDAIVAGDFQKLARCEWKKCGKWFFKVRRKQRFCSGTGCRGAAFASTPKFKADRRVYMKELREKNEAKELGIAVDKLRRWKLEARGLHIKFATLLEQKRRAKKL